MTREDAINLATGTFDQLCLVEMLTDWLILAPDPIAHVNETITIWRERQTEQYDARAKANFEQSGIIATDRDFLIDVLDEAEGRIRDRVNAKLEAMKEAEGFIRANQKPN